MRLGLQIVRASRSVRFLLSLGLGAMLATSVRAADHGDTPALVNANRRDALITDLHTFVRGSRLVLSVCMNPAIPVGATSYVFPSDVTLRVMIDRNGAVAFDSPSDMATYGGTLMTPAAISEEVTFQVTFPDGQTPALTTTGLSNAAQDQVRVYSGLRDDPFIRGPRAGRTVAAIVIEVPVYDVAINQPTLLIWATSHVPDIAGPFQEMAGRALRNMFPENDAMNSMHPSQHTSVMNVPPDVIIYDTSRPARFPNGRELTDDVVDLVGDPRVLNSDAPFPSANDVPFIADFPYLGFALGLEPPPVPAFTAIGSGALGLGMLIMLIRHGRRR